MSEDDEGADEDEDVGRLSSDQARAGGRPRRRRMRGAGKHSDGDEGGGAGKHGNCDEGSIISTS